MAVALLCALVATLAVAVAPAVAAEESDTAPLRNLSEGGFSFGEITGPEAPEKYPFRVSLGEEQFLEQVSPTEVVAFYGGHVPAFSLVAEKAHDADGSNVPTTLEETGLEVVTLVVHHRAGNPAAGGAPFDYPVVGGSGWEGGFRTITVPMVNPQGEPVESAPVGCTVPSLRGLGRRAAAAKLRAANCGLGKVRLAHGATAGKGKVVKQFRTAGTELSPGASVAIKLG
jgi:PASTA domain